MVDRAEDISMICRMCGSETILFHKGTRDRADVDVLKCPNCGLLQLSTKTVDDSMYENGEMLKEQYVGVTDVVGEMNWDTWIAETKKDDNRRYASLKSMIKGKKILDFGCGNGGFLRRAKEITSSVYGVELNRETVERLSEEAITIKASIDEYSADSFDLITMFQVLEHLEEPELYLQKIKSRLRVGGMLLIETPNADDVLLSKYNSDAFMDFTFWSEHVFLYNSNNLSCLVETNGYETIINTQIQRYNLANHLYWLAYNKPCGHLKWQDLSSPELDDAYARKLINLKKADTLWYMARRIV